MSFLVAAFAICSFIGNQLFGRAPLAGGRVQIDCGRARAYLDGGELRMVKSLTIGLTDDGVATWNPVSDGNLLVTGGAGCGKTWWLTHTLIPGLNEMGQRVYMFDGYVDRGYTKPVQGVIPVNDPTSILEEPDSFLIIDHVNPGLEDDSALMETVRESDARIPIILSVQLVPDREQWSAWAELDILSSKYTGMPWVRMGIWESTSRERPQVVAI
ncbi:hypothetical protein [Bifidobacterium longum]|uniref:hypothetical protein n=2 Tax=Bifidobacterium longum TaxID=216816 RepID=UPI0020242AFA|nr:hypothetical protein [Bifidobacterium longum]